MTDNELRLKALRAEMAAQGVDIYMVTTEDAYLAESADDYWRGLRWLTGFGGTLGYALITQRKFAFFADARYVIKARHDVKIAEMELFDVTKVGADYYLDWIREQIKALKRPQAVLGVDGRTISASRGLLMKDNLKRLEDVNCIFRADLDLLDVIWTDRPAPNYRPIWEHELKYTGLDRKQKLAQVREELAKTDANAFIVGTMEGVVWLTNLRGNDLINPLFMSHALVTEDRAVLFAKIERIPDELQARLRTDGWELCDIDTAADEIAKLPQDSVLFFDRYRMNYRLLSAVPAGIKMIEGFDIVNDLKAVKNPVEIENMRHTGIIESASLFKFFHYVKKHAGDGSINELNAVEILRRFRSENPKYIETGYPLMAAYMENAAGPHYNATPDDYKTAKAEGIMLFDCMGHYYGGTVDTTRTIRLGPCDCEDEIRHDYTLTFLSLHRAMTQVLREGCDGAYLDSVARTVMWNEHLQYGYGTGHGVGYCIVVHEGPQFMAEPSYKKEWAFCWLPMKPGNVMAIEPGVYKEGKYGIRLENNLVLVDDCENEFGRWYRFENITPIPFETELLDLDMLTGQQIRWLNEYHAKAYELLAPYMDEEQLAALKEATRPVER